MLSIRGARRALDSHDLFADLDLDVAPGECAAIIGPNGSGKSTLVRCIIDDDRLDGGVVEVAGQPPDERSPTFRALVAAETGEEATFYDLTVTEHLQMLAAAYEIEADAVGNALDDAGLADLGDRFPHALSTGQRQRFALAAVFLRPCWLLVLDEPERGLDSDGQEWLCGRIAAALDDEIAVVVATHSPLVVRRCADVVVELRQ